jgi:serine-type D-Ala-D-Ala carboxypeptidase/endopeptidase (penicillin-binding protein 4)
VGDDSDFAWDPYPEDWAVDDLLWGYGAPVSALTIHDNQINVTITPTAKDSDTAEIRFSPDLPYYTGDRYVATWDAGDGNSVLFEREQGSKTLNISGRVATKAGPEHEAIAIEDPAEYAALALKTALEKRGVHVQGQVRPRHWDVQNSAGFRAFSQAPIPGYPRVADLGRIMNSRTVECSYANLGSPRKAETVLATHQSPTVAEDVLLTNKVSQNLHAEIMLRNIAGVKECDTQAMTGARWVRQYLLYAGLDKDDFVFYDGSGLSGHDLVTPRATAKLLQFATGQTWFADWKKSLPVGGEDGTLAGRFAKAPLKDHLFAKTGTLGEARALSGYLECASGRTVVFSIMVGDHMPGSTADRDVMDRMVAAIWAAE